MALPRRTASSDRLHLSAGVSRCNKFCAVLGGDLRIAWQTISDGRAKKTTGAFLKDVRGLVSCCLGPTSCEDQLECMRNVMKPFNMTCKALGSCLCVINHLGRHLPGSNDATLCTSDNALKRALLGKSSWRRADIVLMRLPSLVRTLFVSCWCLVD